MCKVAFGGMDLLWREIQPIVVVVRDALWLLEEKKPEMGVFVFLFQLVLHIRIALAHNALYPVQT